MLFTVLHSLLKKPKFQLRTSRTLKNLAQNTLEKTLCNSLKICSQTSNLNHGRSIHAHIIKSGVFSLFLNNHLLVMYLKIGDLENGVKLFDEMPQRNVVSWSSLITGFSQNGFVKDCLFMFFFMYGVGVMPNEFTIVSVLNACSLVKGFSSMRSWFSGKTYTGVEAVGQKVVDLDSCTVGYSSEKMVECVSSMRSWYSNKINIGVEAIGQKVLDLDFQAYLQGKTVECIKSAYQVYGLVIKLGFEGSVYIVNAFVMALLRNGEFLDALRAFDKFSSKDTVSWNSMMNGYFEFLPEKVPEFWLRMIRERVDPDGFSFSIVLTALSVLGSVEFGVQVHGQLIKYGHGSETCVGNSLMEMYLKTKNLFDGFKVFNEMGYKNVLSWTAMANGCLICGASNEAIVLIREMKNKGMRPNKFTVSATLKACANIASLEEGKKTHGLRIKLGQEMDLCVDNALLDMYVKCGSITDANAVFCRMNDRSTVSWTTMIAGFAQNGQPREALRAFNEMVSFGMNPNHITLLCLLYACSQGGFVEEGRKYFSSMSSAYGIEPQEYHYACMVNLLGRGGYIEEAEELISKMPFEPGPLVWQTLLGACHIHGDVETAKKLGKRVLCQNQSDPSTYVLLSNIFASLNQWDGVGTLREEMETRYVRKMSGSSWLALGNE